MCAWYEKRLFTSFGVCHSICVNFVNFVNHVVFMVIFFSGMFFGVFVILFYLFYFIFLLVFSPFCVPYFCIVNQAFSWKTICSNSFVEKRIYFFSCKVPGDNGNLNQFIQLQVLKWFEIALQSLSLNYFQLNHNLGM